MKLTKLFACVLAVAGMMSCGNGQKKNDAVSVELPIAVQLYSVRDAAEANFEKLTFRKYVSENKLRIGGLLLSGISAALSIASISYPRLAIPIRTAVMYTGGALLGAGTIIAAVKAAPKGKKFRAFLSSLSVTASSYAGMAFGWAMADNQVHPADVDSATNPGNTVSNESRGFFDNILDNAK